MAMVWLKKPGFRKNPGVYKIGLVFAPFDPVNTPPAQAGGFGLRLKAGSVGHSADWSQLFAK